MIPKEKIEELRERASIVDVVSEYVQLNKRGANHLGLCPFHSEKTPSFSVSEAKKIYYCFGCNETGNAITFGMKMEGISFPEAVRSLAARFGVKIAEERRAVTGFKESLLKANEAAADYFTRELYAPGGGPARAYLKKRGYGEAGFIKGFRIGYAPEKWEGLVSNFKKSGVAMEVAEKAGLVVKKPNGQYDRFRGRLIFPISDIRGRVIGFGGRTLAEVEPKYLNSPETPVFRKGEVLFGLHQAKRAMHELGYAIVVEGYFDLLALHRSGFTNSVATMGTAMTEGHLRALKGYAKSVYALFDTDTAGRNAAIRSLNLFLSEGVPCRAVVLPAGKDPDEFLSVKGKAAMEEAIKRAEPLMEFYLKELGKKFDLTSPEGKSGYLGEALTRLKLVENVAERGHYAATVSTVLGIPLNSVYDALGMTGGGGRGGRAGGHMVGSTSAAGSSMMELTILKVILKHPELLDEEVEAAMGLFSDPALVESARTITGFIKEGSKADLADLVSEISDKKLKSWVASGLFSSEDGFVENPRKMLDDCLKKVFNRGKLKVSTEEIIKRLEDSGRADTARKIRERAKRPHHRRG
jgi:DNA primase